MPSAARPAKVQRWIDVIAALLVYHYPMKFEQLAEGVPAPSPKRRMGSGYQSLPSLALDMPIPDGGVREILIPPTDAPDHAVLEAIDHAVRRRKRVEFEYWSIEQICNALTVEAMNLSRHTH